MARPTSDSSFLGTPGSVNVLWRLGALSPGTAGQGLTVGQSRTQGAVPLLGCPKVEVEVGSPPAGLDQRCPWPGRHSMLVLSSLLLVWGVMPWQGWGRGRTISPGICASSDWCLQAGQALASAQACGFVPCRTLTPHPVPAGPGRGVLGWQGQAQAGHKDK